MDINNFFKPFYDLQGELKRKYGVEMISQYLCEAAMSHPSVLCVEDGNVQYFNRPIEDFAEFHAALIDKLRDGYVAEFTLDEIFKRRLVLTRRNVGGFPYWAALKDKDGFTMLDLEYDDKADKFRIFRAESTDEQLMEDEARERMGTVRVSKIELC